MDDGYVSVVKIEIGRIESCDCTRKMRTVACDTKGTRGGGVLETGLLGLHAREIGHSRDHRRGTAGGKTCIDFDEQHQKLTTVMSKTLRF